MNSATLLLCLVLCLGAHATLYTRSATSGDWASSTQWSPNGVPGQDDDVIFTDGQTISLSSSIAVKSVNIQGTSRSGIQLIHTPVGSSVTLNVSTLQLTITTLTLSSIDFVLQTTGSLSDAAVIAATNGATFTQLSNCVLYVNGGASITTPNAGVQNAGEKLTFGGQILVTSSSSYPTGYLEIDGAAALLDNCTIHVYNPTQDPNCNCYYRNYFGIRAVSMYKNSTTGDYLPNSFAAKVLLDGPDTHFDVSTAEGGYSWDFKPTTYIDGLGTVQIAGLVNVANGVQFGGNLSAISLQAGVISFNGPLSLTNKTEFSVNSGTVVFLNSFIKEGLITVSISTIKFAMDTSIDSLSTYGSGTSVTSSTFMGLNGVVNLFIREFNTLDGGGNQIIFDSLKVTLAGNCTANYFYGFYLQNGATFTQVAGSSLYLIGGPPTFNTPTDLANGEKFTFEGRIFASAGSYTGVSATFLGAHAFLSSSMIYVYNPVPASPNCPSCSYSAFISFNGAALYQLPSGDYQPSFTEGLIYLEENTNFQMSGSWDFKPTAFINGTGTVSLGATTDIADGAQFGPLKGITVAYSTVTFHGAFSLSNVTDLTVTGTAVFLSSCYKQGLITIGGATIKLTKDLSIDSLAHTGDSGSITSSTFQGINGIHNLYIGQFYTLGKDGNSQIVFDSLDVTLDGNSTATYFYGFLLQNKATFTQLASSSIYLIRGAPTFNTPSSTNSGEKFTFGGKIFISAGSDNAVGASVYGAAAFLDTCVIHIYNPVPAHSNCPGCSYSAQLSMNGADLYQSTSGDYETSFIGAQIILEANTKLYLQGSWDIDDTANITGNGTLGGYNVQISNDATIAKSVALEMNGGTFEFAGGFTCDKMSGFGTLKFSEPSSITSMSAAYAFLTFSGFHSTPLTISNFVFSPSNVFTFTLTETRLILGNGTINYYGSVQVNDNSIFQVLPNSEFQINAQPSVSVTLDDSSILINNGSVKVVAGELDISGCAVGNIPTTINSAVLSQTGECKASTTTTSSATSSYTSSAGATSSSSSTNSASTSSKSTSATSSSSSATSASSVTTSSTSSAASSSTTTATSSASTPSPSSTTTTTPASTTTTPSSTSATSTPGPTSQSTSGPANNQGESSGNTLVVTMFGILGAVVLVL